MHSKADIDHDFEFMSTRPSRDNPR